MGCDIHLKVQSRQKDGTWKLVPAPKDIEWHNEWDRKYKKWFGNRNYDAFAILADVRNGTGFAGVVTGERLIPISSELRGLPKGTRNANGSFGDHSFHWLTLQELLDYPHWDAMRSVRGVVSASEYARTFRGKPRLVNVGPATYSNFISGGGITTYEEKDYLALGDKAPIENTYVGIEWPESYSCSAGLLYSHFMPSLKKWADDHSTPYEFVRIVFGFDS